MRNFFVLSLPRSRTAWLANFLTYENSYCFHEGLIQVSSPHHLPELFRMTGKHIVGNSDCGNVFFTEELKEAFPQARYVVIRRDLDEVLQQLDSLGEDFVDVDQVLHAEYRLKQFIRRNRPMVVDYHELNSSACEAIWKYCIGTPFDAARWSMLDGLDVQIIPEKKIEQMREYEQNIIAMTEGFH